jgi:hypothetical protein
MMSRQARRSGLVMGLDTYMIAESRLRPHHPTITNETSPHYAEALASHQCGCVGTLGPARGRELPEHQWHARGQGFESSQLDQAQRIAGAAGKAWRRGPRFHGV